LPTTPTIEREVLGVSLHTHERRAIQRWSSSAWWCPFCEHSNQLGFITVCGGCGATITSDYAGELLDIVDGQGDLIYHATSTVESTESIPDDIAQALQNGSPLPSQTRKKTTRTLQDIPLDAYKLIFKAIHRPAPISVAKAIDSLSDIGNEFDERA
jgi:hypothetical protein